MKHFVLLLLAVSLVACSSRGPKLQPPSLMIAEMRLDDSRSNADIRLRLKNTAARTLPVTQLSFSLTIDGLNAGEFSPDLSLDIPPLGSEVVEVETSISEEVSVALEALDRGSRSRIRYELAGEILHSDGKGEMSIDTEGFLNPTPGRPGTYR